MLPAGLPPVMADPMGLERIIVNLLTNALKYSPGSPVRISACRSPGALQITVADRGPGIDAEDLPLIFERFYRGGSAGQSKGSGLGLYISRLLAEAHGGKIRAISRVGKGTAFILSLPKDPPFSL